MLILKCYYEILYRTCIAEALEAVEAEGRSEMSEEEFLELERSYYLQPHDYELRVHFFNQGWMTYEKEAQEQWHKDNLWTIASGERSENEAAAP